MNELVIRIKEDGSVAVEENQGGIKSFKAITPDSLLACINSSLLRGSVSSGLLPMGCISFTAHDSGDKEVVLLYPESKANISFLDTEYPDFPLPRLVFGFHISKEGRISSSRLGVIAADSMIKPDTKMFRYPLSNVSGFHICTGNNALPKCESLHTLGSLPYLIMAMPNNLDYFRPESNKQGLEMRELLELLKDKSPAFYYTDVLVANGKTLNDFISGRSM